MAKDGRDLAVSHASPQAIAALDFLREQWLAYGNRLAEFLPAVDRDPDCPMIVMMTALLHLSMENRQGYADARPFLDRARAMSSRVRKPIAECQVPPEMLCQRPRQSGCSPPLST